MKSLLQVCYLTVSLFKFHLGCLFYFSTHIFHIITVFGQVLSHFPYLEIFFLELAMELIFYVIKVTDLLLTVNFSSE